MREFPPQLLLKADGPAVFFMSGQPEDLRILDCPSR
jgi:hypothetical protein